MRTLCRYGFDEMNLQKIRLDVHAGNVKASKTYERVGFRKEGLLRHEIYRRGRRLDVIRMGLLRAGAPRAIAPEPPAAEVGSDAGARVPLPHPLAHLRHGKGSRPTCWRTRKELPRWWPSVYLRVEELEAGGEDGVGKRVRLHTKGWLPYTLDWEFRVTESRHPHGFSLEAYGDLAGRGIWTFEEAGAWTLVTYDWQGPGARSRFCRPSRRCCVPCSKPTTAGRCGWGRRACGWSSRAAARPHRRTERAIPPPPPATTSSPLPLIAAGVAVGALAFGFARVLATAAAQETPARGGCSGARPATCSRGIRRFDATASSSAR